MQSVPREWLDFLRQQFPKDSRIQLTEIGGNPRPISPGSTGKLDYIDDAGQFHVKWDNGCTLALVLGRRPILGLSARASDIQIVYAAHSGLLWTGRVGGYVRGR